jgi:hypothetical protein
MGEVGRVRMATWVAQLACIRDSRAVHEFRDSRAVREFRDSRAVRDQTIWVKGEAACNLHIQAVCVQRI